MGLASTPDPAYKAYKTKAAWLLRDMKIGVLEQTPWNREAPRPLPWDGPWVQVGRLYNVGAKMVVWMMGQGMIERRGDTLPGMGVGSILYDWYRLTVSQDEDDLGDLWIE